MMSAPRLLRRKGLVLGVAAASLVLAACSSTSSSEPSGSPVPSVSADAALAAMVPDSIKSTGKMTIGTDASYAPAEFIEADGTTITGSDIDLGNAIAAKLGLQGDFQNATFDSIIVGVDKGKFDAGISSFSINNDRLKAVNMVSFFSVGTAWAAATGNPKAVDPNNACGLAIAVQKGTVQAEDIAKKSETCVKNSKAAIDVQTYTLQSDATTAVVSGKADAVLADFHVISYAVQQSGKVEQIGDIYASAPQGIVVAKSETDFAKAVQGAVNALIADGTYKQILDKWNLANGAITKSELNPQQP
jgi:polar amino acid transport system substrate-binding protein